MNQDYEITIVSDTDYEKLIAEISYKGKFIALLHQEEGIKNIKIHFADKIDDLELIQFIQVLKVAAKKLVGNT